MRDYASIVHRASEATGLKDFNSEAMEADDFRKVFLALQDAIRSINGDESLIFGVQTITVHLSGSALTFKPYTDAELAVIAGGGSVDITDRVVDLRPTIPPVIYLDKSPCLMVDMIDLPQYGGRNVFAWNPGWDQDTAEFANSVAGTVVVQARKPIAVPDLPTDEAKIPERMYEYIVLYLAVNIATKLGLTETLTILQDQLSKEAARVTKNVTYSRPVVMNSNMSRYNV